MTTCAPSRTADGHADDLILETVAALLADHPHPQVVDLRQQFLAAIERHRADGGCRHGAGECPAALGAIDLMVGLMS